MKLFVVVALFAFVAIKLSQAVPVPDDKKDEVATSSAAVPEVTSPTAAPVEVKSETPVPVAPAIGKVEAPAAATV